MRKSPASPARRPMPVSWTPDQVAALTQLNKRTVLEAIHRGELRAWRPTAKAIRVLDSDLWVWVESNRVEAAAI